MHSADKRSNDTREQVLIARRRGDAGPRPLALPHDEFGCLGGHYNSSCVAGYADGIETLCAVRCSSCLPTTAVILLPAAHRRQREAVTRRFVKLQKAERRTKRLLSSCWKTLKGGRKDDTRYRVRCCGCKTVIAYKNTPADSVALACLSRLRIHLQCPSVGGA